MHPAVIEHRSIETLREFYCLMAQTRETRALVVEELFSGKVPSPGHLQSLMSALSSLETIPETLTPDLHRILYGPSSKRIELDLGIEFEELVKDIIFLRDGEQALMEHLAELHDDFEDQVRKGSEKLAGRSFNCLITDRDGTIANICGRYRSSVQSAWNAFLLCRFFRKRCQRAVCVTSAPMTNPGVLDVSVTPMETFYYAASSGREYFTPDGNRISITIPRDRQRVLTQMNEELQMLMAEPSFELFALIGSGLQKKFGQTSLARQDIYGSVPVPDSERLLDIVRDMASKVDPSGERLLVHDSGLDIEIILALDPDDASGSAPSTSFDKGDGIRFLNSSAGLDLVHGPHLVCGDDASDMPMFRAVRDLCPDTAIGLVGDSPDMMKDVQTLGVPLLHAASPDILTAILGAAGR